eukprot:3359287-Karenia_brevis.AAC.1
MLSRRADLHELYLKVWHSKDRQHERISGPVFNVKQCSQSLRWKWVSPWHFVTENGDELHYLDVSEAEWAH